METIVPVIILFSIFLIGISHWDIAIFTGWSGVLFLVVLGAGLLIFLARIILTTKFQRVRNPIFKIFLIALIIRLVFATVFTMYMEYTTGDVYSPASDEEEYEQRAWKVVQENQTEYFYKGFVYFVAGIYSLFGRNPYMVKVFNCLLGALTCVYVYLITRKICGSKVAHLAGMFCVFYPFLIWWTVYIQKDALLGCMTSLITWEVIKKERLLRKWIILSIAGFLLLHARTGVGIIVISHAVIYLIVVNRDRWRNILAATAIMIIFVILLQFFPLTRRYFTNILNLVNAQFATISFRPATRDIAENKLSPMDILNFFGKNPHIFLYNIAHLWLSPMPWRATSFNILRGPMISIGWLVLMIMIPEIVSGSIHLIRLRQKEGILLISLIVSFTLGYGSAYLPRWRHRVGFIPLAIILASIGFTHRKSLPFQRVMAVLFIWIIILFNLANPIAWMPRWSFFIILSTFVLAIIGVVYKKLRD